MNSHNRGDLVGGEDETLGAWDWPGSSGPTRELSGPTLATLAFGVGMAVVAMRRQARGNARPAPPRAPRWVAPMP
jgi:hypothetical protein